MQAWQPFLVLEAPEEFLVLLGRFQNLPQQQTKSSKEMISSSLMLNYVQNLSQTLIDWTEFYLLQYHITQCLPKELVDLIGFYCFQSEFVSALVKSGSYQRDRGVQLANIFWSNKFVFLNDILHHQTEVGNLDTPRAPALR
jgi:hypothetical protein